MFEIKLSDTDVSSGSVPITWCVDQETLKYLADNNTTDPQVVIVVVPTDYYSPYREQRYVVPLKDLMAYIPFNYPGPNKIWAFIALTNKKNTADIYLGRRVGYVNWVLNSFGEDYYGDKEPLIQSLPIDVDVPQDCFAEEPFDKEWVNWLIDSSMHDQCQFRRRRLFAYTIQPLIMFFNLLVRLLFLFIALMLGSKNTSLKPLLHPIDTSFSDAFDTMHGGTVFIRHLPEDDHDYFVFDTIGKSLSYFIRKFWMLPFIPILFIPISLGIWKHPVAVPVVLFSIVSMALMIVSIMTTDFAGSFRDVVNYFISFLAKKQDGSLWYMDKEEMDLITCQANKNPLTYNSLPSNKKTLKLRYLNLKSKVCKPFSA